MYRYLEQKNVLGLKFVEVASGDHPDRECHRLTAGVAKPYRLRQAIHVL